MKLVITFLQVVDVIGQFRQANGAFLPSGIAGIYGPEDNKGRSQQLIHQIFH